MTTTTGRRRLKPEQRRELILDSALRAFDERGYHAAPISEIAHGAGTTKAVVYDHFDSKRDLYEAVVRRELAIAFGKIEGAVARETGRVERVRAGLDAFFANMEERPHSRRVMLETVDAEPRVRRWQERTQSRATSAIAALLARELDVLPDHPERERALEMVAQMSKTALNGLSEWWAYHPEVPREVVVDHAVDFLLGALGGPPRN